MGCSVHEGVCINLFIEHYIIHYTVYPEVSKGEPASNLGLRYLSQNGAVVANYVMLNSI